MKSTVFMNECIFSATKIKFTYFLSCKPEVVQVLQVS
jgi:hypothetical protein